MSREIVVVGAGFKGFCACLRLMKNPRNKIHLIDASPVFGGIMHSRLVNGFAIDNGVQMFDSVPQSLADVVTEVMSGEVVDIDFVSESAFNGVVTQGFSLPDLSSLDAATRNRITGELLSLAARGADVSAPVNSLGALFRARYGDTAGGIFSEFVRRIYGANADEVEDYAISQTSLGRLKHLDDPEMLVLKSNAWLDGVLAARRRVMGKVDDFVSVYPAKGGMLEFCNRFHAWLTARGVSISLPEKITALTPRSGKVDVVTEKRTISADLVVWTNDNTQALTDATGINTGVNERRHTSSMVLIALETSADAIKNFTYLQDFDPGALAYRTAAAGIYGRQIADDGRSFVTCECPAVPGSEFWKTAESRVDDLFAECKSLGVVREDAVLKGSDVFRAKVTHRMPLVGFDEKLNELCEGIARQTDRVIVQSMKPFNRRQIYLDSEMLESV